MSRRAPKTESESHRIDRLVLGIPPDDELVRRMRALRDAGWSHREIGELYDLTFEAVQKRLERARKVGQRQARSAP